MIETTVHDPARQRWIVLSVAFAAFMCTLDTYIVNISLPGIATYFNASISLVSYVVLVYFLVLTSTIPLFGKLGDILGLVRVFIAGYLLFTLGSLLCGCSSSIAMLIAARGVQALGGAILFAIPTGIVPRYLPQEKRGPAFGILATAAAAGLSIGAPIGGILIAHLNWRWIFFINVPVGMAAIIVIKRFFPQEGQSTRTGQQFDFPGVLLSFLALSSLLYALSMGHEQGFASPGIVFSFLLAPLSALTFVWWESRQSDPLLDVRLFANRNFTSANLSSFFIFVAMSGNSFILPFYLIFYKKMAPDKAGFMMMLFSVTMMAVAPLGGRLSNRLALRLLASTGVAATAAAWFFFASLLQTPGELIVSIFLVWMGISIGLFVSPNNNQIMSSVPREQQGVASAAFKTMTNLGSALGVCLFETIFSGSFHLAAPHQEGPGLLPQIPLPQLAVGLEHVYLTGTGILLLALLFSLCTREQDQPGATHPIPAENRRGNDPNRFS